MKKQMMKKQSKPKAILFFLTFGITLIDSVIIGIKLIIKGFDNRLYLVFNTILRHIKIILPKKNIIGEKNSPL